MLQEYCSSLYKHWRDQTINNQCTNTKRTCRQTIYKEKPTITTGWDQTLGTLANGFRLLPGQDHNRRSTLIFTLKVTTMLCTIFRRAIRYYNFSSSTVTEIAPNSVTQPTGWLLQRGGSVQGVLTIIWVSSLYKFGCHKHLHSTSTIVTHIVRQTVQDLSHNSNTPTSLTHHGKNTGEKGMVITGKHSQWYTNGLQGRVVH